MDKWLTLDQAAKRLNLHEHDLLDLAIDGKIIFHWLPDGFDQMGIDIIQVELTAITVLDDEKYEGWKPVKDSKLIKHNFGPFLIDITIDDRWSLILDAIKNKYNVRYDCFFGDDDNLRFKHADHVYKAYFDDPLTIYLPKPSELNVRSSELEFYRNLIASEEIKSNGKNSKMEKQCRAILEKLHELNITPKKVPKSQKDNIEKAFENNSLFNAETAFKNAWQRLLDKGEIETY